MPEAAAIFRYRVAMGLFILGLLISGITAFPLLHEMRLLADWLGLAKDVLPDDHTGVAFWILTIKNGLEGMYAEHPWIAYGTDWLAFGHIVIALFFVHPWLRPKESRPVIYTGIVACLLVVPLALICGPIRGIPFYWRLIDCSFGVIGIVPLLYCLSLLKYMDAGRVGRTL